jgi:hypothetical protein
MSAHVTARRLVAEADAEGSSSKLAGCWVVTADELATQQKSWDDGDEAKEIDPTLYPYWIITDNGVGPIGITGANDRDLHRWADQYDDTDD